MKIPYNKTRQFQTSELPGVICDPTLTFEFVANPPLGVVQDLSVWLTGDKSDWNETRRLAALLIKAVIIPDGTRFPLGTIEEIEDLASQTEMDFVVNLLNGWNTFISIERLGDVELKKVRALSGRLFDNAAQAGPQKAS